MVMFLRFYSFIRFFFGGVWVCSLDTRWMIEMAGQTLLFRAGEKEKKTGEMRERGKMGSRERERKKEMEKGKDSVGV